MDVEKPTAVETTEVGATETKKKDNWDKWNIVLKPIGGLLTAIAIALLGFIGSHYLEARQETELRIRLYTELITKREEAESALRKDMFTLIISPFLKRESSITHEESVLNLELLAYNFHESLNLKPLFIHLKKKVIQDTTLKKKNKIEYQEYLDRLDNVAREITRKQMAVLETAGKTFERTIDLDSLQNTPGGIQLEDDILRVNKVERHFRIKALDVNSITKEIKIRLEIRTSNDFTENPIEAEFWIGFFDFPMIDNTRLSHDQRCGIVLNKFEKQRAEISLLYFPGSHASLKEKPYYQEIIDNLLPSSRPTNNVTGN